MSGNPVVAAFRYPAFVAAILLLVGSALAMSAAIRAMGIHLRKLPIYPESGLQFHSLHQDRAIAVPGWTRVGEDEVMSAEAQEELGTSNFLSRQYAEAGRASGASPRGINLHLAYYTGMIDTVPHVPERCLVGGGMNIAGPSREVAVPLTIEGRLIEDPEADPEVHGRVRMGRSIEQSGRLVRLPRDLEDLRMMVTPFTGAGDRKYFAGYFFIANGGTVASAYGVRDLAFKLKDDYAYYAKVQFGSADVESAEELAELAASLLDQILPDIMLRLPDWVEVREGRYPL